MGKYTKQTAALKATSIDVRQLNSKQIAAKNIIVETGYNQQSDIVSYIKEKDNEVSSKFVESTYTVENDGGVSGNVVLFILPCDAYPQNVPFSRMTVQVTSGVPQMESGGPTTPVYLGVVQWNADGTKEIYGISDNQVTCNKWSEATWNFDTKPIVFTNDYRLIFYFIVNKEDFTTTEPPVYKDKIKITTRLHKTLDDIDPYNVWDRALTDLRLGWICNNSFSQNASYPNWPVCTFTTSKLTQLIQTSDSFIKNTDKDWVTVKSEIITGHIVTNTHTTNIGGRTNATEGSGAQISKGHYIPGGATIKEISAYWSEGVGGSFTDAYCHINVYDSSENIIKQMISTSTTSRNTGASSGKNTWTFAGDDTTTLPQDYRYVVIKVSNETTPNNSKAGAIVQWSVANINNTSDHQSFADDCKLIGAGGGSGTGPYLCLVDTVYVQKGSTLPERVNALENKDYDYLFTDVNTNISNLQNTVNTHTEQITYLTDTVRGGIKEFTNSTGQYDGAQVHSFQLTQPHFIPAGSVITELHLPYNEEQTQGLNNQVCHLQFFNYEGTTILAHLKSNNKQSRAQGGSGTSIWTFDAFTVPDYGFVRVTLSGSINDNPNGQYGLNCSYYRVRVVKQNGQYLPDDDKCKLWSDGQESDYVAEVSVKYYRTQFYYLQDNIDQVNQEVQEDLDSVQDQIDYLDQKVTDNLGSMQDQINGLDQGVGEQVNQASGRIDDLEQQNQVLTNTLGELIHTIDTNNTTKFSNSGGYDLDNATIKGFRLSAAHFIKDKRVTSLELPYTYQDGESPADVYLYIELYNAQNECILRQYSISPDSQTSDKSVLHYEFAALAIPEEYQYAQFALVTADVKATLDQQSSFPDIVQGTNCSAFRARPLRSNGSVDFDGDDCLCFDTNQNQLNWLVSVQGAYIVGFNLPSAADYSFRVTPIYTEAGDMDYFNVSSGNVYMENKQIVQIPTKTQLRMNSDMGTSQYVLLTVSNKADGSISYSYKAVNETEMEVLGYQFVTPVEEDLSIDTASYGENNVASTLSIEDPGMVMSMNLDEGDVTEAQEIEPILTNL